MKAHQLLDLAVAWMRETYPGSLIVNEFSVADWGGARVDVAAITENEIVGVEIKGDGDSPARLDLQGHVYGRVCRKMWLLPSAGLQDKCFGKRPAGWGRLEVIDGAVRPYNRATKLGERIPTPRGGYTYETLRDESRFDPCAPSEGKFLCPRSMCGTLWRDELFAIAKAYQLKVTQRPHVHILTDVICEQLPAPAIHTAMIEALRRRVWRKPIIDTRFHPGALGDVQETTGTLL
jgi:hypothetical protein